MFQDVSSKIFFFKIFLTDWKILKKKLGELVRKFFYQSEKILKKNFCLKFPETQSKTKKLKEFNIFFKNKIFPLVLKNTCKIFMSKMFTLVFYNLPQYKLPVQKSLHVRGVL